MKKIKSIWFGVNYRLSLFTHYISKKEVRTRVPFKELIYHLTSPQMHNFAIENTSLISKDDSFLYYKIKGFDSPFIYPKQAPFYSFAMVISEGLRPRNWHFYEIENTKVLEGDVIVDCGSAEGFFAFKYQSIAKHIYIIEPVPMFINSLHRLFEANKSITIIPKAVGDTMGKTYMGFSSEETAINASISQDRENGSIEVEIATIDSLFSEKGIVVNYLKADLEGFEEKMILGALDTIKMSKPKIAITTYHDGQDYLKLISIIKAVVPEYNYLVKGIEYKKGNPVMLHMWV